MEGRRAALDDELTAVTRAMEALEAQRAGLGDAVVETALAPLRRRRAELERPRSEERRLVSVVFADLVDFTVLSRTLDAEDTREVVNAYFAQWQQAIESQGGVIEKFIGDAVMAVFGLRQSFEDDAQRAVRAALRMTAALPELSDWARARYGVELHMRTGVDTGEVVVSTLGDRAGGDFVAVGPTVNRASRLQAAAPVDRVLISADTHRQIRGRFSFHRQEPLVLKGMDAPVETYVVGAERPAGFGLDRTGGVEGVEALTVGRDIQLMFLQEGLADVVEDRRWRVVSVVGDAGVGKSRLLHEFDKVLAESPERVWWFRGRAFPSARNRAQGLLRDVVAARVDVQFADTPSEVTAKLERELGRVLGEEQAPRAARLMGSWLGFDLGEGLDLPSDPQTRRDLGSELLADYFARLARTAPVVVMLEDLHWADDGSLRWIDAADAYLRDHPVLVVATTRPTLLEERPRWGEGLQHHVRLTLPALTRRQTRQLVLHLLHRVERPPEDLVSLVVDAADGNPFYVEELVTWLIDAGVVVRGEPHWMVVERLIDTLDVPSTLKGVLQSRLDSLDAPERSLLQRASVIGRVFWDSALRRLLDERDLEADAHTALSVLRRREIVYEREASVFADAREFLFKHALLRDVAYDSVLRARRERDHLHVATWLADVSLAAGRAEEYAPVIADHFAKARSSRAAGYYLQAARQALAVYSLEEGARLLGLGLGLVDHEDHLLRFDLLAAREQMSDRVGDRGAGLQDLQAMAELSGHLDAERAIELLLAQARWEFNHSSYDRAEDLAGQAAARARTADRHDLQARAELWLGKADTWADRAEPAQEHLRHAASLAERDHVTGVVGEAYRYLSMVASNGGRFVEALELAERSAAAFAEEGDPEGESMAVAMTGTVQYHLGHVADARRSFESVLPQFRRWGHRYRVSTTLGNLSSISRIEGRLADALAWSRQAIEVADDLGDREARATNLIVLGEAETQLGRYESASAHLREAAQAAGTVPARRIEAEAWTRLTLAELGRGDTGAALHASQTAEELITHAAAAPTAPMAGLVRGYALSAAADHGAATSAFEVAHRRALEGGETFFADEARVGLAVASLHRDDAVAVASRVADLAERGPADLAQMAAPVRVLHGLLAVLDAAGHEQAPVVRRRARGFLQERNDLAGPELAGELRADPLVAEILET